MKITQSNYEHYAIDYLDGELDAETTAQMEHFLDQHPSIRAELDEMQEFVLVPDEDIVYQHKAALKKPTGWVYWRQWSLIGTIMLVALITAALFTVQLVKPLKQGLKAVKTTKNKAIDTKTDTKEHTSKTFATTTIKAQTKTDQEEVKPTHTAQNVKETQTEKAVEYAPKLITTIVDSLEKGLQKDQVLMQLDTLKKQKQALPSSAKDSSKLKLPIPQDIRTMPMAAIDSRTIQLEPKISHHKVAIQALAQVEQLKNQPIIKHKSKKIKTPFGNIKLGQIAEAFLPESYVVTKK